MIRQNENGISIAHAPDAQAPDVGTPDAQAPDAQAPDAQAPDAHKGHHYISTSPTPLPSTCLLVGDRGGWARRNVVMPLVGIRRIHGILWASYAGGHLVHSWHLAFSFAMI
jgi:hypothetical protein